MGREGVPDAVAVEVLFLNQHMCCICNTPNKHVHIHHIDGDGDNNARVNLAVLCLDCHSQVTSESGLGRRFSIPEVVRYKNDWEGRIAEAREAVKRSATATGGGLRESILSEIETLQQGGTGLAATLARVLKIADQLGHAEAAAFCARELRGWTDIDKEPLRGTGKLPYYRQVVAYGSLLDLSFLTEFFTETAGFWAYMAQHSDVFIEYKYFISLPVFEMEKVVETAEPEQPLVLKLTLGDLPGEYESPNKPFYAYSRASAVQGVLTKIAVRLSGTLMRMLENSR